jgi:hypothetical protein
MSDAQFQSLIIHLRVMIALLGFAAGLLIIIAWQLS